MPACGSAQRTSKITKWGRATILSHPLGTWLCRHLLLFSRENLRSQKGGEAPAGRSSKNRPYLRMFPREMLSPPLQMEPLGGRWWVPVGVCAGVCAWGCVHGHVFCCGPFMQTWVPNRRCLCVRAHMRVSDIVSRAECVFGHMHILGLATVGLGSPDRCAHVCARMISMALTSQRMLAEGSGRQYSYLLSACVARGHGTCVRGLL